MKIIKTSDLTFEQKHTLFNLWNSEYPEKICYREISEFEIYLNGLEGIKHFLCVDDCSQIFGWAFIFVRDKENWFGIIINSKKQAKGFGTLLLKEIKKEKSSLNGWVIDHSNDIKQNGELYSSPLNFYFKNGFCIQNIKLENNAISAVKINWERE